MILQPEESRIPALSALWQTVFGDDESYTDLFFRGVWKSSLTFAAEENGEPVSVLYLLHCGLRAGGKDYKGFYLYAAATAPSHRNRGHMGRLIEEAKAFCRDAGGDFIALLPASPSLYAYYEKFGFQPALSVFAGTVDSQSQALQPISMERYADAYRAVPFDRFFWEGETLSYALSCLAWSGFSAFAGPQGFLLSDGETVEEVLAPTGEAAAQTLMQSGVCGKAKSPFALPGFKQKPNGCIWTQNAALAAALQRGAPYMNLALD